MVIIPTAFLSRRIPVLTCSIAVALLGVEFNQTVAAAELPFGVDLQCVQTQTATNTPGVTLIPQEITSTVEGGVSSCQTIGNTTIKSGNFRFTVKSTSSCDVLLSVEPYNVTYRYNNGQYSKVYYGSTAIVTSPTNELVLKSTGRVTEGEFAGHMATLTVDGVTLDRRGCVRFEGVTKIIGSGTLTFTRQ